MSNLAGKTLGNYKIIKRIGRGGMAEVNKDVPGQSLTSIREVQVRGYSNPKRTTTSAIEIVDPSDVFSIRSCEGKISFSCSICAFNKDLIF